MSGSPSPPVDETAPTKPPDGLADVPLELIEREIEELAAHITAGHARWLDLVAEFDRRTGWANTGCRSTSEWVAWRCALTPRSSREHVRVARALPGLPLIAAAFRRGELSYSKIRALTRVADDESEEKLLELARHATAAQLDRMVRAARRVSAAEANDLHETSFLRWSWDDEDGSLRIEAKLSPEDGALFLRALESARDALYEQRSEEPTDVERGSAEPSRPSSIPPPPSPTNAESFAALSEAALARPPTGLPGGERYQVFLHVDAETLATDSPGASLTGGGECSIGDGPALAPEAMRRLTCDCALVPVSSSRHDGRPRAVGRRTRSIPPSIRRALVARDGRCQFPGCERHRFVDAHHIVHWARGGETSLQNLVLLCRHHHRLVHEGGFSLSLDSSGHHTFTDPRGSPIGPAPSTPVTSPSRLRVANATRMPAVGPLQTGSGEKMDLAACVDAVLAATAPRPARLG